MREPTERYAAMRRLSLEQAQKQQRDLRFSSIISSVWRVAGAVVMMLPLLTSLLSVDEALVIGLLCLALAELVVISAASRFRA